MNTNSNGGVGLPAGSNAPGGGANDLAAFLANAQAAANNGSGSGMDQNQVSFILNALILFLHHHLYRDGQTLHGSGRPEGGRKQTAEGKEIRGGGTTDLRAHPLALFDPLFRRLCPASIRSMERCA